MGKNIIGRKRKSILWALVFWCLGIIFAADAHGASLPISSVSAFGAELNSANTNDVMLLGNGFLLDLANSASGGANATIPTGDSRNLIIDGENKIYTANAGFSGALFTIAHNGTGTLTIQNMQIKNMPGQVFKLNGTGQVRFENVIFEGNTGSSIDSSLSGALIVDQCDFISNKERALNDGQNVLSHDITVTNSYFYQNKSIFGAALNISSKGNYRILNSSFIENEGAGLGYAGGAVSANQTQDFTLDIERSFFSKNIINGNVGGAIALYRVRGANATIKDSVFEENKSLGSSNICDGGAIAIKNNGAGLNASSTISGCNFISNYAYDNGGAFLLEASNGGVSETQLYNCTFVDNNGAASATSLKPLGYGGAVQLYGATNTKFFFNTFYKNRCGLGGRGAAIGVNYGFPTITNNIFIDNKTNYNNKYQNLSFQGGSEDVANNNGNIGYDNGNDFVPGDPVRNAEVISSNVFRDFYQSGDSIPSYASIGDAKPTVFDSPVGAPGNTAERLCYVITPLTDEMYRTNSRTVDTGIYEDVRGFPREKIVPGSTDFPYYPNAGAVEIYWTKFDPGTGNWNSAFDITGVLGAIKTLIPGSDAHYIVTDPPTYSGGVPQHSSAYAFPRDTLQGPTNHGFLHWEDDKAPETRAVNELYHSRKQTYVAKWLLGQYHLDFNLNGGTTTTPSHFDTQIIIDGVNNNLGSNPLSDPTKSGFIFDGWYADRTLSGAEWNFASDQVFVDTTLYAKWEIDPFGGQTPTPSPDTSARPYPEPSSTNGGGIIYNPDPGGNVGEIIIPPALVFPLETIMPTYTPSVTPAPPPLVETEDIVADSTEEVPITGEGKLLAIIALLALAGGAFVVLKQKNKSRNEKF